MRTKTAYIRDRIVTQLPGELQKLRDVTKNTDGNDVVTRQNWNHHNRECQKRDRI